MKAVEVVSFMSTGHSGYPVHRRVAGLDMDSLDGKVRDEIAQACSEFDAVTVHTGGNGLNLAENNSGIRRESVRQCFQAIEFAQAIGASVMTFHPGQYTKPVMPRKVAVERNVEFGTRAADLAERYGLQVGFEDMGDGLGNHLEFLAEIIAGIGSERFGLLFDVGHASMLRSPHPYKWLREFAGRIVQMHLHGSFYRSDRGVETHMPLEFEDCLDLADLFERVHKSGFAGPMIFEIIAPSAELYLERANQGKEIVKRLWPGS